MLSANLDGLNSILTPTWWKEETISRRLSPDRHRTLPCAHIQGIHTCDGALMTFTLILKCTLCIERTHVSAHYPFEEDECA